MGQCDLGKTNQERVKFFQCRDDKSLNNHLSGRERWRNDQNYSNVAFIFEWCDRRVR